MAVAVALVFIATELTRTDLATYRRSPEDNDGAPSARRTAVCRLRQKSVSEDGASTLARDPGRTLADLPPDTAAAILKVAVHGMSNPRSHPAVQHLPDQLNSTNFNHR